MNYLAVSIAVASADKAKAELGWEVSLGLDEICASIWRFERIRLE